MTTLAQDLRLIDEHELKLQIRDWRHGRATRRLGQALSDGYMAVIGVAMIGAMLANVILQAQQTVAACSAASCSAARLIVPFALGAAMVTGAMIMSRLFGPVMASAAEGFWLLDAPLRRSRILWSRLVGVLVGALVIGAGLGALVAALTGSPWPVVIAWGGAVGLGTAATVSFAAAEQGANRRIWTRIIGQLFAWVALVALLVVVGIAAGWMSLDVPERLRIDVASGIAVVAAVILVLCTLLAILRLNNIRRARLLSGGALVTGLSGAFYALDLGLAHDIVVERRALEKGHVRAYRGRGSGPSALAWRELQRMMRYPAPLAGVAATLVVPYACTALGLDAIAPFISALCLFVALVPLLGGLRVLTRTGGLARCLPFSTSRIRATTIIIPGILCAIWGLITMPAYWVLGADHNPYHVFLTALCVAAAGLIGAVRWVVAKPVDFSRPMVATASGAMPPGLFLNLVRGIDMCLVITFPLLLHWPPLLSVAIAAIALGLLLVGGLDTDAMRQRQEDQQKKLKELRANNPRR